MSRLDTLAAAQAADKQQQTAVPQTVPRSSADTSAGTMCEPGDETSGFPSIVVFKNDLVSGCGIWLGKSTGLPIPEGNHGT